ncbi:MAG: hypothetical protein J0H98_07130 [Solirubrobacterales bacterium]|nr:hypothetical protein [Solirubrobacterales bacterium]
MNVLKKADRIRLHLLGKATFQFVAAAACFISALGVRNEVLILILVFAIAVWCAWAGRQTLIQRSQFKLQAEAERVLRGLLPELEGRGFKIARQHRLPPECRNYLVVFTPSEELAFVIGLAGTWPGRASLEGPQQVATELSSYGTPHVPVILAAFMEGAIEDYPYGVLAVSPQRLPGALEDVDEAFHRNREQTLKQLRAVRHQPAVQETEELLT